VRGFRIGRFLYFPYSDKGSGKTVCHIKLDLSGIGRWRHPGMEAFGGGFPLEVLAIIL